MTINYTHSENLHSLEGPRAVLPVVFGQQIPTSLLDVGCGIGTWLKVALELGVKEAIGIDGIDMAQNGLLVSPRHFKVQDLTQDWNLNRRFDIVLCMEVAEHLPESAAGQLLDNLTLQTDLVVFSAAAPKQPGDHHLNTQWPSYWQALFNARGFRCEDALRWQLWDDQRIEPWYRQNLFVATRDASRAGSEQRIVAIVHPDMLLYLRIGANSELFPQYVKEFEKGRMPFTWYLKALVSARFAKITRYVRTHPRKD